MTEVPLVVRRWPEYGPGAVHSIDGWVDGKTEAVIVWQGTDGEGPWTKIVTTQCEAPRNQDETFTGHRVRRRSANVAAPLCLSDNELSTERRGIGRDGIFSLHMVRPREAHPRACLAGLVAARVEASAR